MSIITGYFPGSEGLIAPGMYCSYVVTFTPDSLANYQEKLMVGGAGTELYSHLCHLST